MSTRLRHVLTLLTSENQYAYKCKKSTIDILPTVNNQIRSDDAMQLILFDFSKEFGNIERDILWSELYEEGLTNGFIQFLRMWHEGNMIIQKCDGCIGHRETNN